MSNENGSVHERQPLLSNNSKSTESASSYTTDWYTLIWCMTVLVLISISGCMTEAPQTRLYESVICRDYYNTHYPSAIGDDGNVPEAMCKIESIQGDIAMILSYQKLINVGFNLIAWPFTVRRTLRRGRNFVLAQNLFGHLCTLIWRYMICLINMPIRLTWISSVFLLLAGGPEMKQSILFMILSTAAPPERKFTIYTFDQVLTGITASASMFFTAKLMKQNIWIPLITGPILILISIAIVTWVGPAENISTTVNIQERLAAESQGNPPVQHELSQQNPTGSQTPERQTTETLLPLWRETRDNYHFLWKSWQARLLILTFLVSSALPESEEIFLQYVSIQLKWTISEASKLLSGSLLMNIGAISIASITFFKSNSTVLISISRGSAIFQTLGFLVLGLSNTFGYLVSGLVICAVGQAFRMSTRSLLEYMTSGHNRDNTTSLFYAVNLMDIIAGPSLNFLLARTFKEGLKLGGLWIGLPFFSVAILFAVVTVIVFSVDDTPLETSESSGSLTLGVASSAASAVESQESDRDNDT